MNEKEREFKESILKKIKDYQINTTFNECLNHATNEFVTAYYRDGTSELVNVGIEKYLYKLSPLLFLEKNAVFDLPGHGEVSCKHLYYYQKQILLDFQNHKKIVLTKSRQVGLSTLTSLIFFWKAVNYPAQNLLIISKDGTASGEFLEKVKTNVKYIPNWIGISIKKNNVKSLELTNKSKILSFARSRNAGRSFTGTMAVLDEAAFYQTESIINGIVASVVPTLQRVSGTLFVISTPNGTTGEGKWYYEQVQTLRNAGGVDGDAVLYDIRWWMCPDIDGAPPYKGYNDYLKELERRDYWHNKDVFNEACEYFKPIAENPKGNPWLKFAYETEGEVLYRQEILQDFVVMGNSVFSKTTLEKVQEKVLNPIKEGDLGKRNWKGLWYWVLPEKGHRYGIGQDVAKGTADDSTAIQVVDLDTGEQVAEYLGRISTKEAARLVNDLGKYYNNAYIIVECNSIGEAVFNELYYNYNYENMYKMKKTNKHDKTQVWTGWMTTVKTRELITDCFIDYMADDDYWPLFHPHSQRLVDQMKTWVWAGGRPDHTENSHDDDIMAMAILLYNLQKIKQKMPRGEEASKKTMFISEDGREINVAKSKEEEEYFEDKKEEAMDRFKAEQEMPEGFEEDAYEIYKWLLG